MELKDNIIQLTGDNVPKGLQINLLLNGQDVTEHMVSIHVLNTILEMIKNNE